MLVPVLCELNGPVGEGVWGVWLGWFFVVVFFYVFDFRISFVQNALP